MFGALGRHSPLSQTPGAPVLSGGQPVPHATVHTTKLCAWKFWQSMFVQSCSSMHRSYVIMLHRGPSGFASTSGGLSPVHATSQTAIARLRMDGSYTNRA